MLTNVGAEYVCDDIPAIHQNPLGRGSALDAEWRETPGRKHLVDVLGDGPYLALGFAGAEDEIIGDGSQLGDVED